MSLLNNHLTKIVAFDFLLKYDITSVKKLPKLKKITLSANLSSNYKASISILIGILTFIKPSITFSKKNVLSFNLRKGDPVGIKTTLRQKQIENFLLIFLFEILPSSKKLSNLTFNHKSLHWQLKDVFEYDDISDIYIYVADVQTFDIAMNGNNLNSNFFLGWRLPTKTILDK